MLVQQHISLKPYNTFGIDVSAKQFVSVSSLEALKSALADKQNSPIFILGGGSNMLLTKDVEALVIHVNLKGIEVVEEQDNHVLVKAQAGENWHEFVLWCLEHDFGGVENLSLIPGNIGTAPIQNIGAYGVELKDVFERCEAIDIKTQELVSFSKEECQFGYRESIFKQAAKGKYIICNVTLKLTKHNHVLHTEYGAIKGQLEHDNITTPSINDISNAVIAIRESKLPNPKEIGNSGSFFKNPVISKQQFDQLKENFPNIPSYVVSEEEVKVPAGWLIETAGFKGKTFGTYGVHKQQALVLVNYGGAKGEDIFELAKLIQDTIKRLFGISIEMEVNII
ncbi:UDP-N-acetylmuramate dehydrogenase [Mangrovimonas sp. DI 80]|uniref:UDP-N-acetylmuramate dehydrogenase n=1 Tax=Mangrovimonas sp. DI 80 TaxID=1779330 RepID=UPI00097613F6|nr:UDP-N-acetylmuramate dehydrogenase [Mangrovimonas sp. DI 80]OMP31694.1 UDP-N-acetylenolpyruvoylglucosamine reductase [Mangrovimonas sp. DI 80]